MFDDPKMQKVLEFRTRYSLSRTSYSRHDSFESLLRVPAGRPDKAPPQLDQGLAQMMTREIEASRHAVLAA